VIANESDMRARVEPRNRIPVAGSLMRLPGLARSSAAHGAVGVLSGHDLGNQFLQRLLRRSGAHVKLAHDPRGDLDEAEANQVADGVLRRPEGRREQNATMSAPDSQERVEPLCPKCEEARRRGQAHVCSECEAKLHHGPAKPREGSRALGDGISAGHALPEAVRADFEGRFGHDFSHVRVHTDAAAGESAEQIHALAYTVGRHIVFAPGRYAPQTREGKGLLAHELAHVLQQQASGVPMVQGRIDPYACSCDVERADMERAGFELDLAWDWWKVAEALLKLAGEEVRVRCKDPDTSECASAREQLEAERESASDAEREMLVAAFEEAFAREAYEDCRFQCARRGGP
jgi:hypothetical protein